MPQPAQTNILILGFPEFLPRRMAATILANEPRSNLSLLVGEARMKEARRAVAAWPSEYRERCTLLVGDLSALDLGLSGAEYSDLAARVTHVYHTGLSYIIRHPQRYLHERNVVGTQNLLDFCAEAPRLQRFFFFGSIYVSGGRRGYIREEEFDKGQKSHSALEETWRQAERLVRHQRHRLHLTIFRLGNVVGDSRTGEIDGFDGPYLLLALMLAEQMHLPLLFPGACTAPSHLVPIDYVVNAAYHISARTDSIGETYHLTDPHSLPIHRVVKLVTSYLGLRSPHFGIPMTAFKAFYRLPGVKKKVGLPLEVFTYFNHHASYSTTNTEYALQGSGISCPDFENYFPISVEYAKRRLTQEKERREEQEAYDPLDRDLNEGIPA